MPQRQSSLLVRWLRALGTGGLIAATAASAAAAHDFYLLPSAFTVQRGRSLPVDATISASFPKIENSVPADRVAELKTVGGGTGAKLESAGAGSNSLKLRFQAQDSGLTVLAARALPRDVEYAEAQISGIMEEYEVSPEAAGAVANLVKPRVLKVTSSRFAKSFVCVERCPAPGDAARAVGHELEFVAVADAPRTFKLLSTGRPLAAYPVAVVGSDGARQRLRTSADGLVRLPRGITGPAMLFASVMGVPASQDARFTLKLASLTVAAR